MTAMPVTFFLAVDDARLAAWRTLQPDAEPARLRLGEDFWIVLSYCRLRDAGLPVVLDNRVPAQGIVVFYAGDKRAVRAQLRGDHRALLVAVRSDRHPVGFADVEIVQNAFSADGVRALHLPHWPQPALRPRDPTRDDMVHVVLFPGTPQNLDSGFHAPAWQAFLAQRGIELRCNYTDNGAPSHPPNDYGDVDVLLAVRPAALGLIRNKPAWKLFNAWLAGVPAILGPESGYRELREGPLDYLEAATPDAALQALQRLLDEPGLYGAMVANGRVRGEAFTNAATLARWRGLLFDVLAERLARLQRDPPSLAARDRRELLARLRRLWEGAR
ncbi:glycosyltransferase [Cognatiluteimonas telluris]|uniref:glycosyltransferase n=1 Tax=Cognatiluteimonas telluris TaxID=1104775 RepID=UPI001409F07A|nr:glycosyltransferase [Lysobacter telluris]